MKYFVGYDKRYNKDYEACATSLGIQVEPTPNYLITRNQDGSTEFTYSRFLIPWVCNFKGWALYCDSDFIFLEDARQLESLIDNDCAVMVCKHPDYQPKTEFKMQGQKQTEYKRKNWSSLILWNCNHKSNQELTPDLVNYAQGLYLHQFKWLQDNEMGDIPLEWNTLVGYASLENAKALHYTDGTENMK